MQAAVYATWERDGKRYIDAAPPLPGGSVPGSCASTQSPRTSTAASPSRSRRSARARTGSSTTPACGSVVGRTGVRIPFEEPGSSYRPRGCRARHPRSIRRLSRRDHHRMSPATFPGDPSEVTHHYWFRPIAAATPLLRGIDRRSCASTENLKATDGTRNAMGSASPTIARAARRPLTLRAARNARRNTGINLLTRDAAPEGLARHHAVLGDAARSWREVARRSAQAPLVASAVARGQEDELRVSGAEPLPGSSVTVISPSSARTASPRSRTCMGIPSVKRRAPPSAGGVLAMAFVTKFANPLMTRLRVAHVDAPVGLDGRWRRLPGVGRGRPRREIPMAA